MFEECDKCCISCKNFDLFTHYARRKKFDGLTIKEDSDNTFRISYMQEYPYRAPPYYIQQKTNSNINSMMMLDFEKFYFVVGIKRVDRKKYIITLFDNEKVQGVHMLCDFWLPKSRLKTIQGVVKMPNGDVKIDRQFIRVVDTNEYNGSQYVVIKSFRIKTHKQMFQECRQIEEPQPSESNVSSEHIFMAKYYMRSFNRYDEDEFAVRLNQFLNP